MIVFFLLFVLIARTPDTLLAVDKLASLAALDHTVQIIVNK